MWDMIVESGNFSWDPIMAGIWHHSLTPIQAERPLPHHTGFYGHRTIHKVLSCTAHGDYQPLPLLDYHHEWPLLGDQLKCNKNVLWSITIHGKLEYSIIASALK